MTKPTMLPPPEVPRRRRRRAGAGGEIASWVVFAVVMVLSALVFVPLPYVVMEPGPAINTLGKRDGHPLITIEGHQVYAAQGQLDLTTVQVQGGPGGRVNVYDLIGAALSSQRDVLPEAMVYPTGSTAEQVKDENAAEMNDSQEVAAATALRALGEQVPARIVVSAVPEDSPNKDLFKPGDAILAIDGTTVTTGEEIRTEIGKHKAGETVPITVERAGASKDLQAKTVDNGGRVVVGVLLGRGYDLPFPVRIDAGAVGGPSAGTMFSLGIYDLLTPGELTGGAKIAGTGTLSDDGTVGPIGGIAQKLAGAREAGNDWFLAPADNCPEVTGRVPEGLRVVKVATFTDALDAVKAIAAGKGEALPACGS